MIIAIFRLFKRARFYIILSFFLINYYNKLDNWKSNFEAQINHLDYFILGEREKGEHTNIIYGTNVLIFLAMFFAAAVFRFFEFILYKILLLLLSLNCHFLAKSSFIILEIFQSLIIISLSWWFIQFHWHVLKDLIKSLHHYHNLHNLFTHVFIT